MKTKLSVLGVLCFIAAPVFAAAQSKAPDDAQIAAIVVAANQVDVDAGNLALSKSSDKAVKDFAQDMVTDHTAVNKAATDLVTKLNVTPMENPTSKQLEKGGAENVAHLKTLSGAEFDKAYVDHEVAYHQSVIDAIDKTLIPNAQNAELKALLVKSRPTFVEHLDHAKHLSKSVASSGG